MFRERGLFGQYVHMWVWVGVRIMALAVLALKSVVFGGQCSLGLRSTGTI